MDIQIELYKEILRQHYELKTKYTYYLLVIAASAIALSLKRTTGLERTYSMIPLALAVVCWGFSFFYGCRYLQYVSAFLKTNLELLTMPKGEATHELMGVMEYGNEKIGSCFGRQFRLLICGALLFIGWHILEMGKIATKLSC